MSPVLTPPTTIMQPTTMLPIYAGYSPELMGKHFPPSIEHVRAGIMDYRREKGYDTAERYPFNIIRRLLQGEEFEADGRTLRIKEVKVHSIAHHIPAYSISDIEMNARLFLGPIAAAVATRSYLGRGTKETAREVKAKGDGAATEAMRLAFNKRSIRGEIRGGEGGGRDGMTRSGALYMGEPVGTGYGMPVHFLVDPLEVTNSTKVLDPDGAWGGVGTGWSPKLNDPAHWYPGYSGASSLMLAIDAREGGCRSVSDFLYMDKLQVPHQVARYMPAHKLTLTSTPKEIVEAVSLTLRLPMPQIRAAGLARSRHINTMKGWIQAGIDPWNISTPSDGDVPFAVAIAAGSLQFAGLTGGVIESAIAAALGIPLGVRTYLQFVSHDRLGEHEENADLLDEKHRFGFSEREYHQMRLTELFDSQHIGHTLRSVDPQGTLASHIKNAAFAAVHNGTMNMQEYGAFLDAYNKIITNEDSGQRFNESQRTFLNEVLTKKGYLDVRKVLGFSDLITTRSWVVAISAITDSKWTPSQGIRENNNRVIVDTMIAGGSNVLYMIETEIEKL